MNAAITTHNTIKKLSIDGVFTPKQAEHIIDAHLDLTKDLATKNDLQNLEHKFDRKFDRLESRVDKLDARMDSMEQKFDTKYDSLKHDIIAKMWTMQIATMAIIIAAMAII